MSNKAQAALPARKWESDLTAAGVRRNLGDGSNGRFRPPSAAGLGNVQLSVGFAGVVLLPLFTSSTPWKSCWEPKHLKAAWDETSNHTNRARSGVFLQAGSAGWVLKGAVNL